VGLLCLEVVRGKVRMRVALYGGSFNPPHQGHGNIVRFLAERFDQVWVIPCIEHAFGKDLAPIQHRVSMLHWVCLDIPGDVRIIPRPEHRTFDLVGNLKSEHPDVEFTVVGGTDLLHESSKWYRWDDLQKLAEFIYIGREGYPVEGYTPPVTFPHVSSTDIRAALARGEYPVGLPLGVFQVIREQQLYQP